MGASIARVSALPLLVLSLTGWIPDKELEVLPPLPWGTVLGVSFILVGLLGLLFPGRLSRKPYLVRGGLGAIGIRPAQRS